ncbi:MAG: hypothetical protein CMB56_007320 [Methanobacteriota archaeon]|nr:MAG: hypothetical protein CMB56_007320 [Euryarchaeota archaeon]|tara:strand:- start:38670 stop:39155 length:486 start_codon:yes stop_codon:yes gene_type:complete
MSAMGDCELCGKMSVNTVKARYHKSIIESCNICIQKMNLVPQRVNTRSTARSLSVKSNKLHSRKKNLSNSKTLIDNFSRIITKKRGEKDLSKLELAKIAGVRLIDIQNIESGKILEDKVVQKIEKALVVDLFTEDSPLDNRRLKKSEHSGMTLGDFLDNGG